MNALGSLLPIRGSTPGAPVSPGTGATSEAADGPQGAESGSFASTLLQLLGQRAPMVGENPTRTCHGLMGSGEGSVPESPIPSDSAPAGSVAAELAPTESGAAEPPTTAPGVGEKGTIPTLVPMPGTAGRPPDGDGSIAEPTGRKPEGAGGAAGPTFAGLQISAPARGANANPAKDVQQGGPQADLPQAATASHRPSPTRPGSEGGGVAGSRSQAFSISSGDLEGGAAIGASSVSDGKGMEEPRHDSESISASTGESLAAAASPDAAKVDGPSTPESVKPTAVADSFPIDRDPANLDPQFRQRLDRVISRMENEFGHKVQMVEGFRSPQRQKAIYAQGRTQPGPVATWTTDSLHSRGRAADLQVDGSWDNPAGYARLQQVAKEEGLGVLGSKDPGHLELPADGGSRNRAGGSAGRENSSSASYLAGPARVARVASTARVARPAAVGASRIPPANATLQPSAGPTQVSSSVTGPEGSASVPEGSKSSLPEAPKVLNFPIPKITVDMPETGATRTAGNPSMSQEASFPQPGQEISGRPRTEPTEEPEVLKMDASPQPPRSGNEPNLAADGSRFQGARPITGVEAVQRPTTADRVQDILAAGETWDTQAAGRLLVDLDNADGAGTRLRLALRGSELAGTLDLADPVLAGRMRQRIGELHEALSRQGLDSKGLEARAITGIEGRGAADGELAALLKDPLTGLARIMEARDASPQSRGGDARQTRDDSQRGFERFKDAPQRDRNKENQR
jgi:hypothetical protein